MTKFEEIEEKIKELTPEDIEVVKVEPLGLAIAIYVKDISKVYEHKEYIKNLASTLKKKVLVRTEQTKLLDPEKTVKKIKEIVGEEAKITNIWFKPSTSEVVIEALKPGLVIGKEGSGLRRIILETGWSPTVLRTPTMPSKMLEGVRKSEITYEGEIKKHLIRVGKKINDELKHETSWIRVMMLGAFREVGRSCLLVQTKNSNILVDCGINPASFDPEYAYPNLSFINVPFSEIDAVVISHAHTDHIGFLPYLFKYGYEGPVYMTPPSKELTALLQRDYINLMNYWGKDPIYDKKDIQKELRHIITVPYGEVVDITPEMKLTFYNAGHVLGSAVVHLHIGEGKHNLVYSGDIKFGFTQLFNPAETNFPRVETLFMESTYGGRRDVSPSRAEREEKLKKIIKETVEKKGSVLIPVFAVGRSQELMLTLEEFARKDEDWNIPIYIDGMVLEATAIHTAYPEYLRNYIQRRILSNDSPFEWDMIKVAKGNDRSSIVNEGEPAVILAPSGMLTGGPSVDYLKLMAEDERNTLIFVGYQSSMSLGAKIQKGIKEIQSTDERGRLKTLKINMRVETVEGFSGHSDRKQLMSWVKNLSYKPRRIFTMHGDYNKTEELARDIWNSFNISTAAPFNLEAYRLR